ncbi:MAG: DNA translocase FtsK 4TM domain-containing protein [Anaerolineae bacterium]|nr:DNA translocase FtsK 4TM domain-containing protein [Anaerolineae bacterium]
MAHVFISYSRKDKDYADKLMHDLRQRGFDVWIDTIGLEPSAIWWKEIERGIEDCGAFVLLVSPDSDESGWVYKELSLALHYRRPIFPVLLRERDDGRLMFGVLVDIQYEQVKDGALPPERFYQQLTKHVPVQGQPGQDVTPAQDSVSPSPDGLASAAASASPADAPSMTTQHRVSRPASRARPSIKEGIALDVKLDILGWGLLIVAALLFYGAISGGQEGISGILITTLYRGVGVGWFTIPGAMAISGIWLLWRSFGDQQPEIAFVKLLGWAICFFTALTTFHFIHLIQTPTASVEALTEAAEAAAQLGYGGGWLGETIYMFLMRNLGDIGTFFILVGCWAIGLLLALDFSVFEVVEKISALVGKRRDRTRRIP